MLVGGALLLVLLPLIALLAELTTWPPFAVVHPALLPVTVEPVTDSVAPEFCASRPVPLLTIVEFETQTLEDPPERTPTVLSLATKLFLRVTATGLELLVPTASRPVPLLMS